MTVTPKQSLAEATRADFPLLAQEIHGHPLIYFDNAATSQKPRQVLQRVASSTTSGNATYTGASTR
jgi:cysteine desulfurase (EC 2.8.1.7)